MSSLCSYPGVSEGEAKRFLAGKEAGDLVSLDAITANFGTGDRLDLSSLDRLTDYLEDLKTAGHYPKSMGTRSQEGGRFETAAVTEVHRIFSAIPRIVLADRRFWIWAALARFSGIIDWRFGADDGPAKAANYGVGDRGKDNFLYRMWLRGEIGRDPATADDSLVTSGTQDLWRSHIIRQNYAVAGELRELAKLLKRLNTNLYPALLTRAETESLLLELVPTAKEAAKMKKKK